MLHVRRRLLSLLFAYLTAVGAAGCGWMYLPPAYPKPIPPVVDEPAKPLDMTADVHE